MSVIRVNFLDNFHYSDDVVLVTLDGAGADILCAAVTEAVQIGSALLDHAGVTHDFTVEPGAGYLDLTPTVVGWRLDRAIARELELALRVLSRDGGPGHCYLDIWAPAATLVISRDEYVDVVYPWIAPPAAST